MPPQPTDIVERIRVLRYVHVPVASELMAEAASAIESLRWRLTVRENIIGRLVAENQRLRTLATHATAGRGSVQDGCNLTDEERGPIGWAVVLSDGGAYERCDFCWEAQAIADALPANEGVTATVVPLYPQPSLTDEEREAIETAVRWLEPYPQVASTLRNLLERIGGER
jgi:hypothetical protein